MKDLLEVKNLETSITDGDQVKTLTTDVNFNVKKGETVGIVGESGCGKSVTALSIMQLLPKNGSVSKGSIILNSKNLLELDDKEMDKVRGKEIAMIFQDSMSALNPVFSIGNQLVESIRVHQGIDKKSAKEQAIDLLHKVGLTRPKKIMKEYPFMLSGGMRQRVMIAMALSCNPKLLIADEPTTALDVTIQAQIVELLKDLKDEYKMSMILITHDIGLIAEMADRVLVMYAGEIVEDTDVYSLFNNPQHPYTIALLKSIPHITDEDGRELQSIAGSVPENYQNIKECRFRERCEYAYEPCGVHPDLKATSKGHLVRCYAAWEKEGIYEL